MAEEQRSNLNIIALVVMFAAIGGVVWWFSSLESPTPPGQNPAEANAAAEETPEDEEAGTVTGTVFEARQDQPISGATVVAVGDSGEITAETDDAGNFSFQTRDSYLVVHAESPGLRNGGLNDRGLKMVVDPGGTMRGLQLVLYEPVVVEGYIYGDGRPLEAAVTAHFLTDRSGATDYDYETVDTDVDGAFRLGNLPPGRFKLRVESSGYAPFESRHIDVWAGDIIDVETINLVRGAAVRGSVADASGTPLPGARVSAGREISRTDDQGRFELYGVTPGIVAISADLTGYQSVTRDVQLGAGQEEELAFTLTPRSGIVVRVLDANGNPISGATVTVFDQTGGEMLGIFPVAGEDLYLSDLEGGPFDVEARHDEYDLVATEIVAAGETAELVLAADGVLSGLVLTAAGSSARNAEVRLIELADDGTQQQAADWEPAPQGRFTYDGMVPGRYVIEATAPGHRQTRSEEVLLEAGREASTTIRLGEGGIISGQVTDQSTGQPVAGAQVGFETDPRNVQTDQDGFYQLSGFPTGRNTLVVRAGGYRTELVSGVEAGDGVRKEVNIAVSPLKEGEERSLELVGVGMQIRNDEGRFFVGDPVETAGAARAGLERGDEILSIDGVATGEMSLKDVVEKIRGEEGSFVRIDVRRGEQQFQVEIERERVVMGP